MDNFIANYDSIQYDCENSKFTDPHHKHVITGDLSIVGHDLLRKLVQKSPNFRDQHQILSQNKNFRNGKGIVKRV